MAETFAIPVVTEDDLLAFHSKHFSHVPAPSRFFLSVHEERGEEMEDDDGLGYYNDGVKRTLTDEQIAIFRHSEIQSILRQRELQAEAEAEEAFDGEQLEAQDQSEDAHQSPSLVVPGPAAESTTKSTNELDNHYLSESTIRGDTSSQLELEPRDKPSQKQTEKRARHHSGLRQSSPKRKWDEYIEDSETNLDARTHRRMAREMDEVQVESVDLDY